MLYTVSGRAPSILSAALAILIAAGMHLAAADHSTSKMHVASAHHPGALSKHS